MGLCLSFNCAAEVPIFFFSGPLLAWLGVEQALHVAMGAYVLRLCCYLVRRRLCRFMQHACALHIFRLGSGGLAAPPLAVPLPGCQADLPGACAATACPRLVQALPLLPSPWFVLPCELLQGLTFALAWAAGTVHVKRISPPHLRGTVQSLFQACYTGIGEEMLMCMPMLKHACE